MSTIFSSLLFPPCPSLPILPPFPPPSLACWPSPKPTISPAFGSPPAFAFSRRAAAHRETTIITENADSPDATAVVIRARNRIKLLRVITRVLGVLGFRIDRATLEPDGDFFVKTFFVVDSHGAKIEEPESLDTIRNAIRDAIDGSFGQTVGGSSGIAPRRRAGMGLDSGEEKGKAERVFEMIDGFLKNDPVSLQKDILGHVGYTVARALFVKQCH